MAKCSIRWARYALDFSHADKRVRFAHLPAPPQQRTTKGSSRMDDMVRKISAEDINPRFNWGRALPALGIMGVDFEERVDYRRLHRYRLSRVRQALEQSELGAL